VSGLATYYLYQALANTSLFQAIFMVFYQERAGLSLAAVLWVQTYFVALRAVLDVPFGALADRTSRQACLVAGMLAPALAAALLVWRPTLAVVVAAETLFAIGSALRSGADSALLYDALEDADMVHAYPLAEGRGQAAASLASGTTAVVGALLAALDLRLPYVATVALSVAGAAAALALRPGGRPRAPRAASRMRAAAGLAATTPALRWSIGLAAFAVTASHVYYYLQQPYLRAVGVPLAAFGAVFAATKIVTAATATRAPRIDAALGAPATGLAMAAIAALGLGGMGIVGGPAGAALILTRGLLDGLWMPLTNVYVNRLVPSDLRATMLSLQSLVARLSLAATVGLAGLAVARIGLGATLLVAAASALVAGAALAATASRLPHGDRVIAG
jgi:MFS family permease